MVFKYAVFCYYREEDKNACIIQTDLENFPTKLHFKFNKLEEET